MQRYWIGIAILVSCAGLLVYRLTPGFPLWLQWAGFFVVAVYLLGGSIYLSIRYIKGDRISGGQLGLYPRSWRRWMLDERDDKPGTR